MLQCVDTQEDIRDKTALLLLSYALRSDKGLWLCWCGEHDFVKFYLDKHSVKQGRLALINSSLPEYVPLVHVGCVQHLMSSRIS